MAPVRDGDGFDDAGLTTPWLAGRLGVQPAAVEMRRRSGELLGLRRAGERDYWYPAWQWEETGKPLPVMVRLIATAREAGVAAERLNELVTMRSGLTGRGTLLDAIREGRDEHVLAAVRAAGAF